MKIGNVEIKNNVFLAPMAGITDLPFRIIAKEMGCGLVYSEMVSAKGIFYDSKNTKMLLETNESERPCAIQLFGSGPGLLAEMAKRLEDYPFDIIDINMGCPAPKIVKNGEGSALLKNPKLIGEIVAAVSGAQGKPVTIKIRKGFDESSINAVEVAKEAEANGAVAIAIHGRTREEYYGGKADWNIIKKVKEAVSIPIIGNGDVFSPESAKELLDYTGCDAIMVARGACGDPWIFKRINAYLETGELLPFPSPKEKIDMAIRHAEMLISYKGEYIGLMEMRKHMAWYTKGINGASKARALINSANTLDELKNILKELAK
ncbi:MAG: tRNA dihydrouridine synthase DusB [Lachnospiraceae bacterium]|nr:tRNA dihydrouridine synthase DusB [Lachnospiraceae bacterium]